MYYSETGNTVEAEEEINYGVDFSTLLDYLEQGD